MVNLFGLTAGWGVGNPAQLTKQTPNTQNLKPNTQHLTPHTQQHNKMAKITNKQKIEKYQEVITDMQGLINLLKAAAPSATRFERADFLYLDTKMLDIKRLVTGRQQK